METLNIRQIRFTHNSIGGQFSNGMTLERSLWRLLKDPDNAVSRINSLPKLEVMKFEGAYYVVSGNRRLYLLKKLEAKGIINEITVQVLPFDSERFAKQHTTKCSGRYVWVRNCPSINSDIKKIMQRYRRKKRGLPVSDDNDDDDDDDDDDSDDFNDSFDSDVEF